MQKNIIHLVNQVIKTNSAIIWGRKNTRRYKYLIKKADNENLPLAFIEDSFLRSIKPEDPSISLTIDYTGVYYDATQPNDLENLLNSDVEFSDSEFDTAELAIEQILNLHISKYNHQIDAPANFFDSLSGHKLLLIDQVPKDLSLRYGMVEDISLIDMLNEAIQTKPNAHYIIKIHPRNLKQKGYVKKIKKLAPGAIILTEDYHPISILKLIDEVYVMTSQMGFEACLLNKPVTTFGTPFYAGWGFTNDQKTCQRRTKKRSIKEVFIGAYLYLSHYYDPILQKKTNILQAIKYLYEQKMFFCQTQNQKLVTVGFSKRKKERIPQFLGNHQQSKHYLMPSIFDSKKSFTKANYVLSWGKPKGLWQKKLDKLKINPVIVEDGFIRSVGLGVYFTPPLSLVFDKSGIYYDPNKPSDHEKLCLKKELTESEIKRTDLLIESIKQNQITKYNSEPFEKISFNTDKKIILVIGQVSNDQSIELGSKKYKDNLTFLQDIKASNENCFIVYKPHPDVLAKKRKGHIENARLFADKIITDINIISCIEASDEIHTMTSLSGFDALIRGKKVVTYGMPFYAGWGLTEDKLHLSRRNRKLDLKTLVHITLIDYPRYFDLESKSVITVEKAIEKIKLIRKKTSNTGQ